MLSQASQIWLELLYIIVGGKSCLSTWLCLSSGGRVKYYYAMEQVWGGLRPPLLWWSESDIGPIGNNQYFIRRGRSDIFIFILNSSAAIPAVHRTIIYIYIYYHADGSSYIKYIFAAPPPTPQFINYIIFRKPMPVKSRAARPAV